MAAYSYVYNRIPQKGYQDTLITRTPVYNPTLVVQSIYLSIYIYKAEKLSVCLSVCLSDGHAAYSPDLARIDIVCADNEALIIRLL